MDWEGEPPPARLEVFTETVRSALTENDSPDIGFRWSVNPYRGCYHGCAYCYARPYHQYLGWGAGTDFERKIVVKTNVAEVLRRELGRASWKGELVAFSGITDCYQPLEAAYRLTHACLEVCLAHANPVAIITKSSVIRRDVELLARLAREASCRVAVSIPFADDALGRSIEPWASPVSRRFETLRILSDAGVPTVVGVAPLIPGLNDSHVPEILERARAAGAGDAFMTLLRLPREVKEVFDVRLEDALSASRAKRVRHAIEETRGSTAFGDRMRGRGARWAAIEMLFETTKRRLGLGGDGEVPTRPARRPSPQLELFDRPDVGPKLAENEPDGLG